MDSSNPNFISASAQWYSPIYWPSPQLSLLLWFYRVAGGATRQRIPQDCIRICCCRRPSSPIYGFKSIIKVDCVQHKEYDRLERNFYPHGGKQVIGQSLSNWAQRTLFHLNLKIEFRLRKPAADNYVSDVWDPWVHCLKKRLSELTTTFIKTTGIRIVLKIIEAGNYLSCWVELPLHFKRTSSSVLLHELLPTIYGPYTLRTFETVILLQPCSDTTKTVFVNQKLWRMSNCLRITSGGSSHSEWRMMAGCSQAQDGDHEMLAPSTVEREPHAQDFD